MSNYVFHLAIPITDIEEAKRFYGNLLGCETGRVNQHAIIFNFYGHQLVGHITKEELSPPLGIYPRHFGIIFPEKSHWEALLSRCEKFNIPFYQPPKIRFPGQITEHYTFFLQDPFFNILEFKFYVHPEAIFGANYFAQIGDR